MTVSDSVYLCWKVAVQQSTLAKMKTDNYTMEGLDNKQAVLNMHVASTTHIFDVYHIHNGISSVIVFFVLIHTKKLLVQKTKL